MSPNSMRSIFAIRVYNEPLQDRFGGRSPKYQKAESGFRNDDMLLGREIDYAHYKMLLVLFDPATPASRNRGGRNMVEEISTPHNLA